MGAKSGEISFSPLETNAACLRLQQIQCKASPTHTFSQERLSMAPHDIIKVVAELEVENVRLLNMTWLSSVSSSKEAS